MNSLSKAIGKGESIEIIKEIVRLNSISNHQYENKQLTPLMLAAKYGRDDLIEFLIAEGCPVNRVDKTGRTALSLASNHGHYDVVSLLLSGGADINHQDNDGATPLMICSQSGRVRLVELLLKNGADREVTRKDSRKAIDLTSSTELIGILSQSNMDYYQLKYDKSVGNQLIFEEVKFPKVSKKCIMYVKVKRSIDNISSMRLHSDKVSINEGSKSDESINCYDGDKKIVNNFDKCNTIYGNNSDNDTNSESSIAAFDSVITTVVVLKCSRNFSILQKESEILTYLHQKYLEENLTANNAGFNSDIDASIGNVTELNKKPMSRQLKDFPFIRHAFDHCNVVTFEKVRTKIVTDARNSTVEPIADNNETHDIKGVELLTCTARSNSQYSSSNTGQTKTLETMNTNHNGSHLCVSSKDFINSVDQSLSNMKDKHIDKIRRISKKIGAVDSFIKEKEKINLALNVAIQITRVVTYLHHLGLVWLDLKPSNFVVFLQESSLISYLGDFIDDSCDGDRDDADRNKDSKGSETQNKKSLEVPLKILNKKGRSIQSITESILINNSLVIKAIDLGGCQIEGTLQDIKDLSFTAKFMAPEVATVVLNSPHAHNISFDDKPDFVDINLSSKEFGLRNIDHERREIVIFKEMDCWSLGMTLLQLFHGSFLNFFSDTTGNTDNGDKISDKNEKIDETLRRSAIDGEIGDGDGHANISVGIDIDELKQSDITLARLTISYDELQRQIDTYLDEFLDQSNSSDNNNHNNSNSNDISTNTCTLYDHQRLEIGVKVIDIIRSLLRVNPKERITGTDALKMLSSIQMDD